LIEPVKIEKKTNSLHIYGMVPELSVLPGSKPAWSKTRLWVA